MARLGDSFPPQWREEHATHELCAGMVVKIDCDFTTPPKEKYAVIAAWGDRPLLLLINHPIPQFITRRPHLIPLQVTLAAADYTFLSHDSFADCSQLHVLDDASAVRRQVVGNLGRVCGMLTPASCRSVLDAIDRALTVSPAHKAAVHQALDTRAGAGP